MKVIKVEDRGVLSFLKLTGGKKREKAILALLFADIENFLNSEYLDSDAIGKRMFVITVAGNGDVGPEQR